MQSAEDEDHGGDTSFSNENARVAKTVSTIHRLSPTREASSDGITAATVVADIPKEEESDRDTSLHGIAQRPVRVRDASRTRTGRVSYAYGTLPVRSPVRCWHRLDRLLAVS